MPLVSDLAVPDQERAYERSGRRRNLALASLLFLILATMWTYAVDKNRELRRELRSQEFTGVTDTIADTIKTRIANRLRALAYIQSLARASRIAGVAQAAHNSSHPRALMKKRPQVALLIETSNSYARGLLRGIRRYLSEGRNWTVYLPEQGRGDAPPRWLHAWRGDGVIARIENPRIAAEISRAGLPTVDVSAGRLMPECPMVETDNEVIGRFAFEHLRDRVERVLTPLPDPRADWPT